MLNFQLRVKLFLLAMAKVYHTNRDQMDLNKIFEHPLE